MKGFVNGPSDAYLERRSAYTMGGALGRDVSEARAEGEAAGVAAMDRETTGEAVVETTGEAVSVAQGEASGVIDVHCE